MSRANHCLWIAVTDDELLIGPHFPWTLMFLPEILGIEERIKRQDILSVEKHRSFIYGNKYIVKFRQATGAEQCFVIQVRNARGFENALAAMKITVDAF